MEVIALGALSSKASETWSKFNAKTGTLTQRDITQLFHSMDIYPSESQAHEIWQCCHTPSCIFSIGSLCFFASEMKYAHDKRVPRIQPLSKVQRDTRKLLMKRRSESVEVSYDVFLGGSCNPTTWRRDVAIPKLKEYGISYYNPQVAQWIPELIELENQAKENAKVMFFVIDNQTRSVACMIEAAQIAGTQRKLILILSEPAPPGSLVLGEPISEKEYLDLKQGRDYLTDIVQMQGIPVFRNIGEALDTTNRVLKEGVRPQDVRPSRRENGVSVPHMTLGDKYLKMQEAFNTFSSGGGEIQIRDVKMAFKVLTGRELPRECLETIANSIQGPVTMNESLEDVDDVSITFDQFCFVISEFKHQNRNGNGNKLYELFGSLRHTLSRVYDWLLPRSQPPRRENDEVLPMRCSHIYLGGSARDSRWREEYAIPILKKYGLTHSLPFCSPWNTRLCPLETRIIDNSKVLLFVFMKTERCVAEMLVAAHYVGLGCNIVLCIQYLEEGVVIDGEQLTDLAIKDYNRGRMYLSDLATRAGVPVFSEVCEAVTCAARKCQKC